MLLLVVIRLGELEDARGTEGCLVGHWRTRGDSGYYDTANALI